MSGQYTHTIRMLENDLWLQQNNLLNLQISRADINTCTQDCIRIDDINQMRFDVLWQNLQVSITSYEICESVKNLRKQVKAETLIWEAKKELERNKGIMKRKRRTFYYV